MRCHLFRARRAACKINTICGITVDHYGVLKRVKLHTKKPCLNSPFDIFQLPDALSRRGVKLCKVALPLFLCMHPSPFPPPRVCREFRLNKKKVTFSAVVSARDWEQFKYPHEPVPTARLGRWNVAASQQPISRTKQSAGGFRGGGGASAVGLVGPARARGGLRTANKVSAPTPLSLISPFTRL